MRSQVELHQDGAVATLTLSRAAQRNTLTRDLIVEVTQACRAYRDDESVRVVVFQADGTDFSLGVDLTDPAMLETARAPIGRRRRLLQIGPDLVRAIQDIPQTTIVAMHGYCLGGGGCIALACDLRVVASDLRFGMPEALRGMTMTWRTVPLMVAHFGPARTKELLMTRCLLDAQRAAAWGLANRVVDGGGKEAQAEARRWAHELVGEVPPITASMIKQTVNAVANAHTAMVHMDTDQYILSQQTEDFEEAVRAFLEKRLPQFQGR